MNDYDLLDMMRYSEEELHEEEMAAPTVEAAKAISQLKGPTAKGVQRRALSRWDLLDLASEILAICANCGIHPRALSSQRAYQGWVGRTDEAHMKECQDPRCEWLCCMRARGMSESAIKKESERRVREARRRAKGKGCG
jgi:hypothetical protein